MAGNPTGLGGRHIRVQPAQQSPLLQPGAAELAVTVTVDGREYSLREIVKRPNMIGGWLGVFLRNLTTDFVAEATPLLTANGVHRDQH